MHTDALDELRKLQRERGNSSPFLNHLEFQKWSDEVAPRLAFDQVLLNSFKNARNTANTHKALNISADNSINDAIGLVNQAIIALHQKQLELNRQESNNAPKLPLLPVEKMTLKWIWAHAPFQFYLYGFAGLSAAFTLGAASTEFRENAKQFNPTRNMIQQNASASTKNTVAVPITLPSSLPPAK